MSTTELFKGVEWRRRLTVTEPSGSRTNLTGKSVVLQIRRRIGGPVLVELFVGSGITLLDQGTPATMGQASIVIPDVGSAHLEAAAHLMTVLVEGQVVLRPMKISVRAL